MNILKDSFINEINLNTSDEQNEDISYYQGCVSINISFDSKGLGKQKNNSSLSGIMRVLSKELNKLGM